MRDIKITITGKVNCQTCQGAGVRWPSSAARKRGNEDEMVTCNHCDGDGVVEDSQEITLAEFRDLMNAMESED